MGSQRTSSYLAPGTSSKSSSALLPRVEGHRLARAGGAAPAEIEPGLALLYGL